MESNVGEFENSLGELVRDLKGRDRNYLNVFSSKKAIQREREKLREMTSRHQNHKPIPVLIGGLNRHLRGWMS